MQPHHQDAIRVAGQIQPRILRTEQVHQFVVDNLDDLLSRLDALDDLLAERLGLDPFDEVAGHLEIHIGLEQREPDLPQRVADVGLGNLAQSAQVAEGVLQFAG